MTCNLQILLQIAILYNTSIIKNLTPPSRKYLLLKESRNLSLVTSVIGSFVILKYLITK
ncbi:hypothetical protein C1646_693581 [Rhizophagus diaphanus]|nr:hypothetical protein C1646_693581 [Rhizophagus diaphanus] [Rhizophagus sp. MUCL 43196]